MAAMVIRPERGPEKKKPQRAGQGFYRVMWDCCAVSPERAPGF
jgi:hypothetical protein